jgi:hypothetical protein
MSRVLRIADDGQEHAESAVTVSAGATDAGRIPALDVDGKLHVSVLRQVGTLLASLVENDSSVVGTSVKDALQTLATALDELGTSTSNTQAVPYVTIGQTASLPNERALTPGPGIAFTDAGAGGALTMRVTSAGSARNGTTYTTVLTDAELVLAFTNAAGCVITVPAVANVPYASGTTLRFLQYVAAGPVTVVGDAGVSIRVPAGKTAGCRGAWSLMVLTQEGTSNAWNLSGDLADATSYLTLAATASHVNERILTAGAGIAFSDSGAGGFLTVRAQTSFLVQSGTAYTTLSGDAGNLIEFTNAGGCVVTIPADATLNYVIGTVIRFVQFNPAGVVSVVGAANVFIRVPAGRTAATRGHYSEIVVKKEGTNNWNLSGDLAESVPYLVLSADGSLLNERVLTAGTGVQLTDAGAGGALTLSSTHNGAQIIVTAATYILLLTDAGKTVNFNASAGTALTIPNTSTVNFPIGTEIFVFQSIPPAGQVSITGAGGVSVLIPTGKSAKTAGQHTTVRLRHLDTNAWSVDGELEDQTPYVTLAATAMLPNERVLTAGTNVTLADNPVAGTLTINAAAGGSAPTTFPFNFQTTSYQIALSDAGKTLYMSSATPVTVTVPGLATTDFPDSSFMFITQDGVGQVTFGLGVGVAIRVPSGFVAKTRGRYSVCMLQNLTGDNWFLSGDLEETGTYLTLSAEAALPNERVLTAGNGTGISFSDAGAGGALTVRQENRYTTTSASTYIPTLAEAWASIGFAVACTVTIPNDSSVNFPVGTKIFLQQSATGAAFVTVAPAAGVSLDVPNGRLARTRAANASIYIHKIVANYWMIGGDLADTAQYLTLATTTGLENERALVAGSNVTFADTGPGGTLTVNVAASITGTPPVRIMNVDGNILASDAGGTIIFNGATINATLQPHATIPIAVGTKIELISYGGNGFNLVVGTGVTVNGGAGITNVPLYRKIRTLIKFATNDWVMDDGT